MCVSVAAALPPSAALLFFYTGSEGPVREGTALPPSLPLPLTLGVVAREVGWEELAVDAPGPCTRCTADGVNPGLTTCEPPEYDAFSESPDFYRKVVGFN
jgi:hypothetical protein